MAIHIKPIGKAFIWCLLSLFFGLTQLWFVVGYSFLDKTLTTPRNELLLDCGCVFFCTALVAGLAIDFFSQDKKLVKNLGAVGLFYAFYPMLIFGAAIVVYSVCFRGDPDMNLVVNTQVVVLFMSLLYAVIIKAQRFSMKKG